MNPTAPTVSSPRRIWPWVVSLCVAPFVILGVVAYSFLTLDRDAAALRKQVMAATNADWHTKVQLSVGRLTLGAVRVGLSFVDGKEMDDARQALDSVRRASVGVYARTSHTGDACSREALCVHTDDAMSTRGWSRLVGVLDDKAAVLVYVPKKYSANGPIDICVAVLNERELVVVATTVSPDGLAELVQRHAGDELKRGLKLAKF